MPDHQIVVPLRIEAKYFEHDKQVTPPLADFSKLPWNKGSADINFNQPYISDGIVHEPFESGLMLDKGLHLHFILPHFLGKEYPVKREEGSISQNSNSTLHEEPKSKMPAAPNRWLITKHGNGISTEQWLIQSDYVYDVDKGPSSITSIIPAIGGQPYRYMGKKIDFLDATKTDPNVNHNFTKHNAQQDPLTVVGYGDINYSSFYPNCLGVFGIHDGAVLPKSDTTISYQVIGWVAEDDNDIISKRLPQIASEILNSTAVTSGSTTQIPPLEQFTDQVKKQFGIELEGLDGLENFSLSGKTLYCGVLTIDVKDLKVISPPKPTQDLRIAIGNTGTEALSALLANTLSNETELTKETNYDNLKAKSVIEDQLEAILMRSKIDHLQIDVGPKFREARHDNGFKAHHSGHLWKVKSESNEQLSTNSEEAAIPPLPSKVASLLNALNTKQAAYDKAVHEIRVLQEQLYTDWVKYMHARYPKVEGRGDYPKADHIQYFIKNYSMPELAPLLIKVGKVVYKTTASQHLIPTTQSSISAVHANDLVSAWTVLNNYLQEENIQRTANQQPSLFLAMISGPRFWAAKAPVILFSGLESENIPKQTITCKAVAPLFELPYSTKHVPDLTSGTKPILDSSFIYDYKDQKWTPFILDWSVEVIDTHLREIGGNFKIEGLSDNFVFNTKSPDFETSASYIPGKTSVFSGSVLMSGHAKLSLSKNIEKFFQSYFQKYKIAFNDKVPGSSSSEKYTLQDFLSATAIANTPASNWNQAVTMLDLTASIAKSSDFSELKGTANISNLYFTAWVSYEQIKNDHVLSQNLDGFNEACIMKKKVAQLPIAEPIGFNYEKAFTKNVNSLVQGQQHSSPVMAFEFNPIRSGALNLDMLSLIDNFGVSCQINTNIATIASDTMQDENRDPFLKPRLSQPARLNLRWSSATPADASINVDTNDSPETSPICGWLLANYLDNDIAVYDASGAALGYISLPDQASAKSKGIWNTVPWADHASDIDNDISNLHLKAVVDLLCNTINSTAGANTNLITDFLTSTQHALDNIAPSNSNIYNVKSILMGRPMAVVRSRISYEVMGKPAIDQSWSSLLTDLSTCERDTPWSYDDRNKDNWEQMLLPCRLGEYKQLNDGLVGYWVENSDGKLAKKFISPEMKTADVTDSNFEGISDGKYPTQWLAANNAPVHMTMLMDPRGVLHATTGLLPTKSISIPPEHYLPAMQKIEMWFKSFPILQAATSDNTSVPLNVPPVTGYQWQWWDAFQGSKPVSNDDQNTNHHDTSKIIEGWLSLVPNSNKKS